MITHVHVTDTFISITCRISESFYNVERHLCNVPPLPLSEWVEGEIIIDVFTSSTTPEDYTIEVTPVEDAMLRYINGIAGSARLCFILFLRLDSEVQLEISANSPAVQ